jgi:integrase
VNHKSLTMPTSLWVCALADDFQDAGDGILTFAEAQARAHIHRPKEDGAERGAPTVATAIENYIAWLKVHRASASDAERRAAKLILPSLGKFKVADLTTSRLNKWRDALADAPPLVRTKNGESQNYGVAPASPEAHRARRASANRVVTILKAALNKAFNDGQVNDDVEWRRLKPFGKVDAARPGYLTVEEAQRLINAADDASGFRAIVVAALQTGARYGELCALKVRDFQHGKIHVATSKSGKPRDIILTDEGISFFENLTVGRKSSERLFVRPDGGPWLASMQARPMREACERAGINPAIGIHALRHTWASLSVMGGMPLMVVARNLGHASTVMVEKHYGHLSASFIDEAVRAGAPKFGAIKETRAVSGRDESSVISHRGRNLIHKERREEAARDGSVVSGFA